MTPRPENEPAALVAEHAPQLLTKQGGGYTGIDGETIPLHRLYRFCCSCRCWEGMAWYSTEEKAHEHFARHLGSAP